jgi:signal transduction histidine kinase
VDLLTLAQLFPFLPSLLDRTLGGDIKIEKKLDPTLGHILIDPNQLDIAILNLAVNARDAMSGSGTLTIETSNAPEDYDEIKAMAASYVRITIADNGRGMEEEVLPHVFESFFTTKDNGEGTGLGLSQVYGFVNQSGGHVRIESQVNRGTRVHLFLPRAPL